MKLLHNELKSEYRNGSLDCLSDTTQERAKPVFLFMHGVLESTFKDFQGLENHEKIQGLSRTGTHLPLSFTYLKNIS